MFLHCTRPILEKVKYGSFLFLNLEGDFILLRFWGQPKFSRDPLEPVGYELFLREGSMTEWEVPSDFSKFTASQIANLLIQTAPALPHNMKSLSVNLNIDQFIDPQFCQTFVSIQNEISCRHLSIELTEHPSGTPIPDQILLAATKRYTDANFAVILDDVGSGDNQLKRVKLLNNYVNEYKFAVQNFRPRESLEAIVPKLSFWCDLARTNNKVFTIEGVESKKDLLTLSDYQADMLQGYTLGRPVLLPIKGDSEKSLVHC